MKRHDYLQNIWKSYPAMPSGALAAGRIYEIESEGSSWVLHLQRDQKIVQIRFDQRPELADLLIPGDIVAVIAGPELILLAPQLSGLPNRQFDKSLLQLWGQYQKALRSFFISKDFVEVRTPSLVPCPGTEPSLDVFSTTFVNGSDKRKLFLPTSPELHLKKTLALGAEKIFEIAPCYRNGEVTEFHQPEFLMLEWYRAYDNLSTIKKDVVDLVQSVAAKLNLSAPTEIRSVTVAELFKQHCQFDLKPETSMEELKALSLRMGIDARGASCIDDYFFLIFIEKIESQIAQDALIFVEKYPPYQAALARLTEDGWGDRFEVYWKGMELANAFHELNDPTIQRQRTAEDLAKKKASGKESVLVDEEFFLCLDAGFPPSGGIALGVERLFMALTNTKKISDLRVFPLK